MFATEQVPDVPLMRLDAYLDLQGPFSEAFRNADSTWSAATADELASGLRWWRRMLDRWGFFCILLSEYAWSLSDW